MLYSHRRSSICSKVVEYSTLNSNGSDMGPYNTFRITNNQLMCVLTERRLFMIYVPLRTVFGHWTSQPLESTKMELRRRISLTVYDTFSISMLSPISKG